MTNFLKATTDPLSLFIFEHYSNLHYEFFNGWMPKIARPKLMFTWDNGQVPYKNQINSAALKLSDRLLDLKEREGIAKIMPISPHMYPVKELLPDVWDQLPTWQRLINTFDNYIEALFVNVMHPGSEIFPHHGVDNHCFRQHLCLQNNLGFSFNIGGEIKKWGVGPENMFRFDDGNILHGVSYEDVGDSTIRVVMIFDILKEFYV